MKNNIIPIYMKTLLNKKVLGLFVILIIVLVLMLMTRVWSFNFSSSAYEGYYLLKNGNKVEINFKKIEQEGDFLWIYGIDKSITILNGKEILLIKGK